MRVATAAAALSMDSRFVMSQSNRWTCQRRARFQRAESPRDAGAPGRSSAATRAPASSKRLDPDRTEPAARAGDDCDLMVEAETILDRSDECHERASSTSGLLRTSKVRKSSSMSGRSVTRPSTLLQLVRAECRRQATS